MTNAFTKTTIAAAAFALSIGAISAASATSVELRPGVQLQQNCYQKPVKVTKYVRVYQHNQWVNVPKTVIVHKTVCEDYHTWSPSNHSVHQDGYQSDYQSGY